MNSLGQRTVDVGGHRLRVESRGAGRENFLLLHGLVDTLSIWDALVPLLEGRGRVVRLDQRAHGGSDAPPGPYRRGDLARDAIGVLDALRIERAVLVGHSMGGIVSMQAALDHRSRVAGLVLLGTASECSRKVAGWYERIAQSGERDGIQGIVRAIYGQKSRRRVDGDAAGLAAMTRMLKSLHTNPLTPCLGAIACPTLAVVGTRDPMGVRGSEIIADGVPDARLLTVEAGHWTHVEAPQAILEACDARAFA
jgi:pimeloyl-ACP methyl ester carboxylesterase